MNRMEEYQALLAQLETIPEAASGSVTRAKARRNRTRLLWRPLTAAAVLAVCFVALVNLCPPVAAACLEVPVLGRLVEAVSFSPSLQKAVENDYVQTLGLEQTKNGVTARVEYLIVDQKQVNIFYSLDSDQYADLSAFGDVEGLEGDLTGFGIISNHAPGQNGQLQKIAVDFQAQYAVPDAMVLTLEVRQYPQTPTEDADRILAEFEFLLEFDPAFTAQGRIVPLDQTVDLNGQKITFTELEIYPSHIRVDVSGDPENTAWLKDLEFYLELEDGTRIEPVSNGISAYGTDGSPAMTIFTAESSYFEKAACVQLAITGARFLQKGREWIYVNLETGETDHLPLGAVFHEAVRTQTGWEVQFLLEGGEASPTMILSNQYRDAEGNTYAEGGFGTWIDAQGRYYHYVLLNDYPQTEVWFSPRYTDVWTPAEPVIVEIPQ